MSGFSSPLASPAGDAAREGRDRATAAGTPIDYVRDGAMAAHKKMSAGSLLHKLGITSGGSSNNSNGSNNTQIGGSRASPEPIPRNQTTPPSEASAASIAAQHANAASRNAAAAVGMPKRQLAPIPAAIVTTTRNRKGSLRKNILQRGSLQRMETILSPRAVSQMSDRTDSSGSVVSAGSVEGGDLDDYPTPRVSYDKGSRSMIVAGRGDGPQDTLLLDSGLASNTASLGRSNTLSNNSTTDEDEKPPGSSSSNASSELMMNMKRPMPTADSYFPPQNGGQHGVRRRSPMTKTKTTKSSPLSAMPLDAATPAPLSPETWDYAETEWWGWIILFVTWITFVVGMGSCFGAWSWAWDVGETPYAPPELEDDPTLPIVGYYPALIVLTGVMAWVWVITAWVGMKYFKHAKMSSEDG